jgi:hypothetical protein
MGVKLTLFAPLVTAGVTAATLAIAPIAAAAATHGAGGGGASRHQATPLRGSRLA